MKFAITQNHALVVNGFLDQLFELTVNKPEYIVISVGDDVEPSNWNYTDNTQEFRAGKETVLILGLYSHCTSNVCLVFITRSENKHIILS